MIAYFDTSAFVKLLMHEPGTNRAEDVWAAAEVVVASLLIYAEARAAIARARRARRLRPADADAAVRTLGGLMTEVGLVRPTERIVWRAGALAEVHALRGYDAVHLASAVELGEAVTVVSADAQLVRAARAERLAVLEPV